METLLVSFRKWLIDKQDFILKNRIIETLSTEDIVGEKKRIIINHSKQSKFGQISICEDNSMAIEIVLTDTEKMIFSHYSSCYNITNVVSILNDYLDCMNDI